MNDERFNFRQANDDDESFVVALAECFVNFDLPPWRKRIDCTNGIRQDLLKNLDDPPPSSWLFIAEDEDGHRVGYLHLQKSRDFFNGKLNCHISDLAAAPGAEGRGVGRALVAFTEQWAREHKCNLITLAVFPGNERAAKLYRANGFDTDLLRLAKPVTAAKQP